MFYLEKPSIEDKKAAINMIEKWFTFGGRINPGLLTEYQGDYEVWLEGLDRWDKGIGIDNRVPQTFYFMKNEKGTIVGAASLRHYLNETNFIDGGHIAYGICPEFRGKGYGNQVLQLALEKLTEMKIDRALVVCDRDNPQSEHVILNNHGVLENYDIDDEGVEICRYWINLDIDKTNNIS